MKKRVLLFFVLIFTLILAYNVSAQIIIINETEEKVSALKFVELSGDLAENELNIVGSGQILSGNNVKVYLFGPASDILVENIMVNGVSAPVSFDNRGYFFIVNDGSFTFHGKLKIRTIGQVNLQVPGPLNKLTFDMKHGYAIGGDRYGLFNENIILQRSQEVAKLIDGKFRYSFADRNEFYYIISYKAFGSTLGREIIPLRNNEQISSVTGAIKWEQKGSQLILDLKSDTATVSIRGLFDSNNIKIPLSKGKHKVLLESDPEQKLSISTSATEQDLSEAGIPSTYNNARAFLATYHDTFTITLKRLDVLPSLAASVSLATNRVAITKKGSVLGELSYRYANTGVDYVEMDVPGTPLYASTGNSAVKLTKEDKLMLTLPKTGSSGGGRLEVVYFETKTPLKFIDIIDIPLAKTDLPITTQTTSVYLPGEYFVIETLGAKGGSELPSLQNILLLVLVLGAFGYFILKDKKFVSAYIIFAAGLLMFDLKLFLLLIVISSVVLMKKYVTDRQTKGFIKWAFVGAGILVVLGIIVFVAVMFMGSLGTSKGISHYEVGSDYAMIEKGAAVPQFRNTQVIGEGDGSITVPTKKGVFPVKLELPRLGKTISVTNNLVTKENPVEIKIIIIAHWLKYIIYAIALIAGIFCQKTYKSSKTINKTTIQKKPLL